MPLRWLFLDMNSFFASVEQQEHPELRGRPVGVVPVMADSTCCIAASYEAKAFGVKTGTNVAEARRLCPEIQFIEAKHGPYRDYHNRIVQVVENCTPIDRILSVDEMVCRLWANEGSVDDAICLAKKVKESIRRDVGECLHCSVGLSINPFLAKVAAEIEKPNGLVVLNDKDIPNKLFCLSLMDFPGINKRMQKRFNEHGVFTTQQMYDVSQETMHKIWGGIMGDRWWKMLRGEDEIMPERPRRSVGHSHVLPPELRTVDGAWSIAVQLLEKAAERMRRYGYHACSLGASAGTMNGTGYWSDKVNFEPTADTWTLLEILEKLWKPNSTRPSKVSVVLYNLVPSESVTLPMFEDDQRRKKATDAIDQINRTFGRRSITFAGTLRSFKSEGSDKKTNHVVDDKIAFAKIDDVCDM